jgi:hypothetical protein
MATKKETANICDHCGKEQRFPTEQTMIGGHPLSGWVSVKEHGGGTALSRLKRKKEFDFCGYGCLRDGLEDIIDSKEENWY